MKEFSIFVWLMLAVHQFKTSQIKCENLDIKLICNMDMITAIDSHLDSKFHHEMKPSKN